MTKNINIDTLIKKIIRRPNLSIITSGSLLALIFFIIGWQLDDIWRDLLVNLSASMITVVLTVLLVDMLRIKNLYALNDEPQRLAIQQIKATATSIILLIAPSIPSLKKEFVLDFMKSGESVNKGSVNALTENSEIYIRRLAQLGNSEIASHIKPENYSVLKASLERSRMDIDKLRSLYGFSFTVELNNKVANLIRSYDTAISAFVVTEIDPDDLHAITDSPVSQFIGIGLLECMLSYVDLLDSTAPTPSSRQ